MVILAPTAFAHDWPQRPTGEVAIGLRAISERDTQVAKAEASKWMIRTYGEPDGSLRDPEKAFEGWNDKVAAYAMARATCDCNDSAKPYFRYAEDMISLALESSAIRYLLAEYTLMTRSTGDRAQLSDDDATELGKALEGGALRGLDAATQTECRKMLAWVHEKLDGAELLQGVEDEDVAVYVASTASPSLT